MGGQRLKLCEMSTCLAIFGGAASPVVAALLRVTDNGFAARAAASESSVVRHPMRSEKL